MAYAGSQKELTQSREGLHRTPLPIRRKEDLLRGRHLKVGSLLVSSLRVYARPNLYCLTNWECEANQQAPRADDLAVALAPARPHRRSDRTKKRIIEAQIKAS